MKVLQIINEPCAAVLAYGFPKLFIQKKFTPFNKYLSLVQSSNVFHPMEEKSINSKAWIDASINRQMEEEIVPLIKNDNNNNISNERFNFKK